MVNSITVRVRSPWKEKLKQPTEEELDMLDLAFEPDDDSRLACQILVKADLDGLEVEVPAGVCVFFFLSVGFLLLCLLL